MNLTCENCGGKNTLLKGKTSMFCSFCGTQLEATIKESKNKTVIVASRKGTDKETILEYIRGGSKGKLDLPMGDLKDIYFNDANLKEANLIGANLKGASLENANIQGANLEGADLSGANLSGANLSGANLRKANIKKANLQNANLKNAKLNGANLERTNLNGSDLSDAELNDVALSFATLVNANLSNAKLNKNDIRGIVHFDDSNLSGADFSGSYFNSTHFENANLKGIILKGCSFFLVRFKGFDFRGINLSETKFECVDFEECDLSGADLSKKDWGDVYNSTFRKTNLSNVNLSHANLKSVKFEDVNLNGANLEGADMQGTTLINIDLSKTNLKGANLKDSKQSGIKGKPTGGCFLTTACVEAMNLPDDCHELQTLRKFRDGFVSETNEGRKLIKEYYEIAPRIVEAIQASGNENEILKGLYSEIKQIVSMIDTKRDIEALRYYCEMTRRLKKLYLYYYTHQIQS
jgi:uncharacterized protein YjbI with pentapeptide repeats